MSQLDAIMAADGLPALRAVFGDDATYTPQATGMPITTWGVLAPNLGYVGQYAERAESRLVAQLPVTAIPEPQPGDRLIIRGGTYTVAQLLDQSLYLYKVALR